MHSACHSGTHLSHRDKGEGTYVVVRRHTLHRYNAFFHLPTLYGFWHVMSYMLILSGRGREKERKKERKKEKKKQRKRNPVADGNTFWLWTRLQIRWIYFRKGISDAGLHPYPRTFANFHQEGKGVPARSRFAFRSSFLLGCLFIEIKCNMSMSSSNNSDSPPNVLHVCWTWHEQMHACSEKAPRLYISPCSSNSGSSIFSCYPM